ncbi:MAG: hypothetical protein L0Y72_31860 [Gemmataceae bacterium]|nr:hypothetical protein [Gemmataceae bacterium]MCI0743650.1 hypothetical protein [Gemmataceae bacterium]
MTKRRRNLIVLFVLLLVTAFCAWRILSYEEPRIPHAVTRANWEKVQLGMFEFEIEAIFEARPGAYDGVSWAIEASLATPRYEVWASTEGGFCVSFDAQGRAVNKMIIGTFVNQQTVWEKVLRTFNRIFRI